MITAQDILHFWLIEAGEKAWYDGAHLDARIAIRFEPVWQAARVGKLDHWLATPEGALALLILVDQLPRNMFRGTGLAFASDTVARSVAKHSIKLGHDLKTPLPQRQFFYMPLMHSESQADQDQCMRMFMTNMPGSDLLHARGHREIIRRFGRFPTRNEALDRESSAAEQAFLDVGGYQALIKELRAEPGPAR